MSRFITVTGLVIALAACGASSSVPVKGPDTEVVKLAGDWEGEYEGIDSGRSGDIRFELTTGRRTATGHVMMQPEGSEEAQPLAIEFVQVDGGTISGRIEPYLEPRCDCRVQTEFTGAVSGDVIDGTFVTRALDADLSQKGRWAVFRKN